MQISIKYVIFSEHFKIPQNIKGHFFSVGFVVDFNPLHHGQGESQLIEREEH
jgi:hypothetical protein